MIQQRWHNLWSLGTVVWFWSQKDSNLHHERKVLFPNIKKHKHPVKYSELIQLCLTGTKVCEARGCRKNKSMFKGQRGLWIIYVFISQNPMIISKHKDTQHLYSALNLLSIGEACCTWTTHMWTNETVSSVNKWDHKFCEQNIFTSLNKWSFCTSDIHCREK